MSDVEDARRRLEEKRAQYEPEIERLSAEADRLARQFRRLFAQASDAYSSGAKAEAKMLSIQGREAQAECSRLNDRANLLRRELGSLRDALRTARSEETRAREAARRFREKGADPRKHSPHTSEPSRPHRSKAEPQEHVDVYSFDASGKKIRKAAPGRPDLPGPVPHVTDPRAIGFGRFIERVRRIYRELIGDDDKS